MWEFLSNNWIWILLIGGMLFMHLGHGGQGGHGRVGGCGGHQHSSDRPDTPTDQQPTQHHSHPTGRSTER